MTTELESRRPALRLDNSHPDMFGQTPSQTVGPYFHYGLPWKGGADLTGQLEIGARPDLYPVSHYVLRNPASASEMPMGEVIDIIGCVLDGRGDPVPDAMIEIWQANSVGRYYSTDDTRKDPPMDPHFIGFGRAATAEDGSYRFRTIYPGRVPGGGNILQAPHIAVSVFARGLLNRLVTRIYFDGAEGNGEDPILNLVEEERRSTLLAVRSAPDRWTFDIVLQGDNETVFFTI